MANYQIGGERKEQDIKARNIFRKKLSRRFKSKYL